jgi:hypothetical protein
MKNKIIMMMCFGLFAFSVLSFADDKQVTGPPASARESAKEKATFNHNEGIYNDKANKNIRAKQVVEKRIKSNKVNNKKDQNKQDAKGNLNEKNERDGKNEQYDTRLSVKF